MITGSEAESRALMMNAAVRIVAKYGFEGFTTKKWALEAGVAEGSLYYHFKSKNDLLNETFFMIDQEISQVYEECNEIPEEAGKLQEFVQELWERYYHYLLSNPEKTLFYHRFRTSPRFSEELQKEQVEKYANQVKTTAELVKILNVKNKCAGQLLWCFFMDTTTSLAYRVVTGGFTHSAKTEKDAVNFILFGVSHLLNDCRQ